MTKNIGRVGKTNQKVECAKSAMASLSRVSIHSQTKARMEISGKDRMMAPSAGLRLAISETAAMIMPESRALIAA